MSHFETVLRKLEAIRKLEIVIEIVREIEALVNDPWNVDDTVCQQNMKKIKQLLEQEIK